MGIKNRGEDVKEFSALSFWQPRAWLIANGYLEKDSRTCSPPHKHVGKRIAIHSSQRQVTRLEFDEFLKTVKELNIKKFPQSPQEFEYGCVLGTVLLETSKKASKASSAGVDHFQWCFKSAKKIEALPAVGRRSWFSVKI